MALKPSTVALFASLGLMFLLSGGCGGCDDSANNNITTNNGTGTTATSNGTTATSNGTNGMGTSNGTSSGPVETPTVEALPALTNQGMLPVRGTRTEGVAIFASINDADGVEVAVGVPSTDWSGFIELKEGDNSAVFWAQDTASLKDSPRTETFTVILDRTAPTQPALTSEPPTCLEDDSYTLEGTVEPNGLITVAPGNLEATADENGMFSITVPVEDGVNTWTLIAWDVAGNKSEPLTFEVTKNALTPTLDDVTTPTDQTTQSIGGTKGEDTGIELSFDDATWELAVPVDGDTTWSYDLPLVEGDNTFYLRGIGEQGSTSCATVGPTVIVSGSDLPPAAPAFACLEQTDRPDVRIQGTKDAFTNICLRRGDEETCTAITPLNAGTNFDFSLMLEPGDNYFCLRSTNQAGQQSTETCCTVTLVESFIVTFLEPSNGTTINDDDFLARVEMDVEGIASVEICFDDDCDAATANGDGSWSRLISPGAQENGSAHTLTARATSNQGVEGRADIQVITILGGLIVSDTFEADSQRPQVAVDGAGNVHVVWSDGCSQFAECDVPVNNNFPNDIFHRMFDGTAWTSVQNLSLAMGDGNSLNPSMVSDALGNVHVVWQDDGNILDSGNDFDLFHTVYDAVTQTWSPLSTITTGSDDNDTAPSITTGPEGVVVVVWQRRDAGDNDIYLSRLRSDAWTAELLISNDPDDGDSRLPSVAIGAEGMAYVVWQDRNSNIQDSGDDNDIYLVTASSENVVSAITVVSDDELDGASLQPKIATDGNGGVHIAWIDSAMFASSGPDTDVLYRNYSVGGGLGPYQLVTDHPMDDYSDELNIATDPETGALFLAWLELGDIDNSGADADIYYTTLGGGDPQLVSVGLSSDSEWPAMAFDPATNNLHIVWEDTSVLGDNGDDSDIFYFSDNLTP